MMAGRRRPRGRDATGDMVPLGGLRATVSDVVGRGTRCGTATRIGWSGHAVNKPHPLLDEKVDGDVDGCVRRDDE